MSNVTEDKAYCDRSIQNWKNRNMSNEDKIKEIDSQLEMLELNTRNSIRMQALSNAKESLIIRCHRRKRERLLERF